MHELIVVPNSEFEELDNVQEFRQKIITDYTGVVFCDKLPGNPPIRGKHGLAYIPLKEDATPTRQCAYPMHGEKMEAYRKIVEEWLELGFLEKPTKLGIEWCSAGFPIPKKSGNFPWRGVVDVRGPNSQSQRCKVTLPLIEKMLVKFGGCHIYS